MAACTLSEEVASSGRAATPASTLQMPPHSLRHGNNATSAEYERLRKECSDHRHAVVLSASSASYKFKYLAEGLKSAVFSLLSNTSSQVQFAVKLDKFKAWEGASVKMAQSVDPFEIDATCLVWYMLSARGLSPHVPRVYGVLPFVFAKDAMPYCGRFDTTSGLVMELLSGFKTRRGVRVLDVKSMLQEGMAGRLMDASGKDVFCDVLRVVVFQVLYTIAAWNLVTGNGFRHNDLHAMNVGLTYWNDGHTPVEAEYHLPGPDGTDRVFVVASAVCSTVIDYGYASVLECAGGPAFDPRFYYFNSPTEQLKREGRKRVLAEPKFIDWGMSHRQPSRHYDSVLFMYAILHDLNMKKSKHPAAVEFRCMYARCFGAIHLAKLYTYQGKGCHGRLTPFGQQELMKRAAVEHGKKRFHVMDPSEALGDAYFLQFRGRPQTSSPRDIVFGLSPSPAACAAPLSAEAMAKTTSMLAANTSERWQFRLNKLGVLQNPPTPGLWASLTAKLDAKRAECIRPRQMSASEASAWSASFTDAAVADEGEEDVGTWDDTSAPGVDL